MSFADSDTLSAAIIAGQKIRSSWNTPSSGVGKLIVYGVLNSAPSTSGAALTGPSTYLTQLAPASGHNLYIAKLNAKCSVTASLGIFDRLVHTGGLDGTSTSAQTVNSAALPSRATGGAGVQLWLEWYTATGASASTVTASYTNQAGTSGRTTQSVAMVASPTVSGGSGGHETIQLPLQAGDTGVRSVESVTLSATTGTAGNFGITLKRPILIYGVFANARTEIDPNKTLLPSLTTDHYLEGLYFANSSSGQAIFTTVNYAQD